MLHLCSAIALCAGRPLPNKMLCWIFVAFLPISPQSVRCWLEVRRFFLFSLLKTFPGARLKARVVDRRQQRYPSPKYWQFPISHPISFAPAFTRRELWIRIEKSVSREIKTNIDQRAVDGAAATPEGMLVESESICLSLFAILVIATVMLHLTHTLIQQSRCCCCCVSTELWKKALCKKCSSVHTKCERLLRAAAPICAPPSPESARLARSSTTRMLPFGCWR